MTSRSISHIPLLALQRLLFLVLFISLTDIGRADDFPFAESADFRELPWALSFDALHAKLSTEYPYTEWKGIDWQKLYTQIRPQIAQAEMSGDEEAFITALRRYLFSIPDGHVIMVGERLTDLVLKKVVGGFGLTVARLRDGRVIANYIRPGSSASRHGIKCSAAILRWNGKPVRRALAAAPVLFLPEANSISVREHLRLEQQRLLTRAPLGAKARVTFLNPGATEPRRVRLIAEDDKFDTLHRAAYASPNTFGDLVEHRLLPGQIGYIRIRWEMDSVVEDFRAALSRLLGLHIRGLVVDLRGNRGGSDLAAATISGHFFKTAHFYEYQSYFNTVTGRFELYTVDDGNNPIDRVRIAPQSPYYGGRVIVLVNPGTISSGEGIAMGIQRSGHAKVLGFHGTNGSFGMVGAAVSLPLDLTVIYPFGRSLNKRYGIQLDSRHGRGGVTPDIVVPMNERNAVAYAKGSDVELAAALQALGDGRLWQE